MPFVSNDTGSKTLPETILVQDHMFYGMIDTYDILNLLYISAVLLLLSSDVELNPGPSELYNTQKTLSGTMSQSSYRFMKYNTINTCMANSISAIIYSTILSPDFWIQNDIDDVLRQGHKIYTDLDRLGKCENDGTLIVNNICTTHSCYGEKLHM